MQKSVKAIGQKLLLLIWLGSIAALLLDNVWLRQLTVGVLSLFLLGALLAMRRETAFVVGLIAVLTLALLLTGTRIDGLLQGIERTLIFAAFLPTLQLTRATVRRLPAVIDSQRRFTRLPEHQANVGILFGSQAFGAILNTGAFAIMSGVVADSADRCRRRSAALASLRGMNTAVLWSPFFVGFAVANTYLPAVQLWQIMPLGLGLVGCGLLLALLLFARPLSLTSIAAALHCLAPMVWPMSLAAGGVIVCSSYTSLSTLSAVLLIMPLLCALQIARQPATLRIILHETYAGLQRMGDDLLIIAAAMMLATVTENSAVVVDTLTPLIRQWLPAGLLIPMVILLMLGGGLIGLHPMITGSVLLVGLAETAPEVSDLALMEAMLSGWALASMTSISSLSVVTAGAMYQVKPLRLAFSPNLLFAVLFAIFISMMLIILDMLIM